MKKLSMGLAIISLACAIASPTIAAEDEIAADTQCLVAAAFFSTSSNPNDQEAAHKMWLYFSGKIDVRDSNFDYPTEIVSGLKGDANNIRADGDRCSAIMRSNAIRLRAVADALRKPAP
jgi:hypothetical protein